MIKNRPNARQREQKRQGAEEFLNSLGFRYEKTTNQWLRTPFAADRFRITEESAQNVEIDLIPDDPTMDTYIVWADISGTHFGGGPTEYDGYINVPDPNNAGAFIELLRLEVPILLNQQHPQLNVTFAPPIPLGPIRGRVTYSNFGPAGAYTISHKIVYFQTPRLQSF